ncbi:hypothetical protein R3P38DRAFT_2761207 [Favolaschia claudopus]|uniref:DUF7330 domain-containing protein n=1 Tax=Favolaschia claudopus TaxID=2862362 RepID=A0AAW0DYA0_9AGAR
MAHVRGKRRRGRGEPDFRRLNPEGSKTTREHLVPMYRAAKSVEFAMLRATFAHKRDARQIGMLQHIVQVGLCLNINRETKREERRTVEDASIHLMITHPEHAVGATSRTWIVHPLTTREIFCVTYLHGSRGQKTLYILSVAGRFIEPLVLRVKSVQMDERLRLMSQQDEVNGAVEAKGCKRARGKSGKTVLMGTSRDKLTDQSLLAPDAATVDVDLFVVAGTSGGSEAKHRVDMLVKSSNGSITTKLHAGPVPSCPPMNLTALTSNGSVNIHLPRSFSLTIRTRNDSVRFSDAQNAQERQ